MFTGCVFETPALGYCNLSKGGGARYQYIPRTSLSVHNGPLYQNKEVAQTRASLSVQ